MRRHILGIVILMLLPILSFPVSRQLSAHHREIGNTLNQASQLLSQGDEESGRLLIQQAYDQWLEKRHFTAAFVHHDPLEEIDSTFAAARVAQSADLAACCAQLSSQLHAVADTQQLNWWDLL